VKADFAAKDGFCPIWGRQLAPGHKHGKDPHRFLSGGHFNRQGRFQAK
jgi:hypothetical protein